MTVMTDLPGPAETIDVSFNEDALATLTSAFSQYGDAFRIFSPATNSYICAFSNPEHVRHIFVDNHANYTKGIGIERVRILLGNGIMVSEGDLWRRQRKMIQPAFHREVISRMMADIGDANRQLREQWLDRARRGHSIDLTQGLSEVTLNIVLKAIFGADITTIESANGGNPFMLLTQDTERNLQFAYKFRNLSALVLECVNRRRAGAIGNDLLGMLVASRDRRTSDPMSDRLLVDEVLTLIVAGHETTASALNWLWYLLSRHPEVEARMHAEIDVWEENITDMGALLQLAYTRQVIDETLRLYPPGWLLTRRAINADVIGGHPIDANTDVFVSPYLIHRHPQYWDAPEKFDPDRFSEGNKARRNRFCYLPFALGPRACIGEQFAMVEMIIHTALIARRLRLRYLREDPVELECQVNLRPRQNIMMQLEERR
jgi:cytochrome P450